METAVVVLPADRRQPGTLKFGEFGPFRCLGRADTLEATRRMNPRRDPVKPYGDTPCGVYLATLGSISYPRRTYGPHRVVILDPVSGDALAAKKNKRSGLWVHGGDTDRAGGLRPTYGCLRIDDDTQDALVRWLEGIGGRCMLTVEEE